MARAALAGDLDEVARIIAKLASGPKLRVVG
jgi:hypothetical protein